jgi:hypothetical protein
MNNSYLYAREGYIAYKNVINATALDPHEDLLAEWADLKDYIKQAWVTTMDLYSDYKTVSALEIYTNYFEVVDGKSLIDGKTMCRFFELPENVAEAWYHVAARIRYLARFERDICEPMSEEEEDFDEANRFIK